MLVAARHRCGRHGAFHLYQTATEIRGRNPYSPQRSYYDCAVFSACDLQGAESRDLLRVAPHEALMLELLKDSLSPDRPEVFR